MARIEPINFQTLDEALIAFVNGATDLRTVWGRQNYPRPDFPYVAIERVTGIGAEAGVNTARGSWIQYSEQNADGEMTERRTINAAFTLNVQIFAGPDTGEDDPMAYMASIIAALEAFDFYRALQDAGIVIYNYSGPIDISVELNNIIETRASLDLFCRVNLTIDTTVDGTGNVELCSALLGTETCTTVSAS